MTALAYRRRQNRAVTLTATLLLVSAAIGVWWLVSYLGRDSVNTQQKNETNMSNTQVEGASTESAVSSARYVGISTALGPIIIEMYEQDAPKTVQNFVTLARRGYYDNLIFHRIVKDFVAQGGDPSGDGSGGTSAFGETFEDEINAESLGITGDQKKMLEQVYGYSYRTDIKSHHMNKGAVAMANRGAKTNGSQFFIVTTRDQLFLDGRHTVFGRVLNEEILPLLDGVETKSDRPVTPVVMTKVVTGDNLEEVKAQVSQ